MFSKKTFRFAIMQACLIPLFTAVTQQLEERKLATQFDLAKR